jgi:hypothetical protein
MIELSADERSLLNRLVGDAALMELLQRLDDHRAEMLAQQLIDETQALQPEKAVLIQLGSRISERLNGAKFYLQTHKELSK